MLFLVPAPDVDGLLKFFHFAVLLSSFDYYLISHIRTKISLKTNMHATSWTTSKQTARYNRASTEQREYKLADCCWEDLPPMLAGLTCSSRPSTSSLLCSSIAADADSSESNSTNANLRNVQHVHNQYNFVAFTTANVAVPKRPTHI